MTSSSSDVASSAPPNGYEEARIWTRPLRELTPETSFGFEAVDFATDILGVELFPWQRWFLIHSLELAPGSFTYDESPRLRFRTVLLLVSRQNGKSFLMSVRLLWRMLMWDGPEVEPPLILGAAHKLSAAKEIMELATKALKRSPGAKYFARAPMGAGNESLETTNGARWRIEAGSNDDGGRGLSVTDLGFDELRQQSDWAPWSALTNTTNAKFSSQVLAVSNAGTAKSVVLRALRDQALSRIEDQQSFAGDLEQFAATHDTSMGIFEWSAPDDCRVDDIEGLAQANPSVGWSESLTWEMLHSLASMGGQPGRDGIPEHSFRTEVMCQWVVASKAGPFREEQILACIDNESEPAADSPIALAVDVSQDRTFSYLATASWRADGLPHIEVIVERAGTEWIADYLANKLAFDPIGVVAQGKGAPVSSVIEYIEAEGTKVISCQGADSQAAATRFADRLVAGTVRFRDDSTLMLALREAVKKSFNDSWEWSRKASPVDVAPLIAACQALWLLESEGLAPEPAKSAYADDYGGWYEPSPAIDSPNNPTDDEWWR